MLQVLEARGGGQSAKVLRVESHGGRQQAVKVIDHSASGLSPKLLADELTNWPPLRHESLVQFFGQLELGASYTLVFMELCAGGNLFQYVRQVGAQAGGATVGLGNAQAHAFFKQIAVAV